jgi:predicted transcriptional regulator
MVTAMKKSVYSLVLMDDVVAAIDRLACRRQLSRSAMINQILAGHVAMLTPEQRIKDIFSRLEELMNETFRVQPQQGTSMLSVRSALRFKYKPTIRYVVELFRETDGDAIGRLKVSFRTQNTDLIAALDSFFRLISDVESRLTEGSFDGDGGFHISEGRYVRAIHLPSDPDMRNAEAIGDAIASYIRLLDSLIKLYFDNIDSPLAAKQLIEGAYNTYDEVFI